MLKAIAEKLIPGIPEKTRVSILQQTDASDANMDDVGPASASTGQVGGRTVLEEVIDKATSKDDLEKEINGIPLFISQYLSRV